MNNRVISRVGLWRRRPLGRPVSLSAGLSLAVLAGFGLTTAVTATGTTSSVADLGSVSMEAPLGAGRQNITEAITDEIGDRGQIGEGCMVWRN